MLANYTGKPIIINIINGRVADHSDINNFSLKESSIVAQDCEQVAVAVTPQSNMYIMTQDCSHSGHFAFNMMRMLPKDPIIYVGIKKGYEIVFCKTNLFDSDIDFALGRMLNQSHPAIMLLNPYYFILILIFITLLILVVIMAIIAAINHWNK